MINSQKWGWLGTRNEERAVGNANEFCFLKTLAQAPSEGKLFIKNRVLYPNMLFITVYDTIQNNA